MPGHKLGKGLPVEFLKNIEKLDLTEIPGTDNLHKPTGAIREAQELAAVAFGARRSFFLVNGCTVGLHAAIAAVCRPGQRLIVGRDCHRSVINGMLIAGVTPVYVLPEYSEEFGINTGITVKAVEKALNMAPDATGVLLTRPNYYGVCSNIREITRMVHSFGKPIIVDEAHGSHFSFNTRLPSSALQAGADICIQCAHKTLPAFTQGAYLHIGSNQIDEERLERFLGMFQTTSPSYVVMAFLDIAREIMQKNGENLLNNLLNSIEKYSCGANKGLIKLLGSTDVHDFELDKTRITANVSALGITGYDAGDMMRDKYNIQVEMSDMNNVVCISTVADNGHTIGKLFEGLYGLERDITNSGARKRSVFAERSDLKFQPALKERLLPSIKGLTLPDGIMGPYEILNAGAVRIELDKAPGRISREIISPYPPGIALVCPGETFSAEMVSYLGQVLKCGGIVNGIDENGCVIVV